MSDVQVSPNFKQVVECPCGCRAFGTPKRNGHPRGCPPARCASCRGKRTQRQGARRQRTGISWVEQVTGTSARYRGQQTHEETHHHLPVLVEVKSGAQVGPADTMLRKALKQLEQNRAVGNTKPPLIILMPDENGKDGWYAGRLSSLVAVVDALAGDGSA